MVDNELELNCLTTPRFIHSTTAATDLNMYVFLAMAMDDGEWGGWKKYMHR